MTDGAADSPQSPLFQTERQREIVSYTLTEGRVEVTELSSRFSVTPETIRRDLSELQNRRLLRRVHGGAVPWAAGSFEPLLSVRNDQQDAEKRRIAQLAIEELPDGGTVIIDSGSTLTRLAEAVPPESRFRVVTNSLPTAQTLSRYDDVEVVVVGGTLRKNTMAMVDSQAVDAVHDLRVDTLFISSDGASIENGLSTPYRQEAALKKAMIRSATRVIALLDHSKFDNDHFIRFADWSDIDLVVTDAETDIELVAALERNGTAVRLA